MKKPKLPKINHYVAEDILLILLAVLVVIGIIVVLSSEGTGTAPQRAEDTRSFSSEVEN